MKDYVAIRGTTGYYLSNKEQAINAVKNGFVIYEDQVPVASTTEQVDRLDFEPDVCTNSILRTLIALAKEDSNG